MAKLVKLFISGIRSFGPYEDQKQSLRFETPVTLILGQNGCGKTTIIEAIKYACTAELPSGSMNGQGFVNDPKMSGNTCTKGQIKLKFTDATDNEITASRIVEVSFTAQGNLKFNTKSTALKVVGPDGVERSSSGRCVDVTNECCQFMNVSPSVLNNVIFCHQENSSWPLDEAKKLKEKFDDIFDAQKYSKCSDLLRSILKEKQEKIKRITDQVKYASEKKDNVEKEKRNLQLKETKLQTLLDEIAAKNQELEPIRKRLDEITELENDLVDLQKQLAAKEEHRKGVIEQQDTIRKNFSYEFDGTDEELREKIRSFESDRQHEESHIGDLEKRKCEIDARIKAFANEIQDCLSKIGKFQQEQTHYTDKCTQRRTLIEKSKMRLNVKSTLDCNVSENAKTILRDLKEALQNAEMSLESLIKEKELEESNLQKSLDEVRDTFVATKQKIASKTREIKESEQKIAQISHELLGLAVTDQSLKDITNKIEGIDKTIYNLKEGFNEAEEKQKGEDLKKEIRDKEHTLEMLEGDSRTLQQNDIIEGKMETEKQLIMSKQREINRVKTKHDESLRYLFENEVPEKGLKDAVDKIQHSSSQLVKKFTETVNRTQRDVTTLEAQLKNQTEKVCNAENELKIKQNKIVEACGSEDFETTLSNAYDKKEKLQHDKGQYKSAKLFYDQFLIEFQKDAPCCPICDTNFNQKGAAVAKIIVKLKNRIEKVPKQLMMVGKELEKQEEIYDNLQQLKLVNDEIENLQKVILPSLRERKQSIEIKLKNSKQELENVQKNLSTPQKRVDICRNIISDIASLDQNLSDVTKSQKALDYLKQNVVQVASKKSKQEVEAEIDNLRSDVNELRRAVDSQQKKVSAHKERIHKLTQERTMQLTIQMQAKEVIQSKPALETQKTELSEKVSALKDEINDLASNLALLEAELNDITQRKNAAVLKNKQEIQKERNDLHVNKNTVEEIAKVQKEIEDYLRNEIDRKLDEAEASLNEKRIKASRLEEAKNTIIDGISTRRENLAKQEMNYRTLQDNVTLREKTKLENSLVVEIQNLKTRIGGFNYRTVRDEKQRLTTKQDSLSRQVSNITGQMNELQNIIEELRHELNKPENRQAFADYMRKFYEHKILVKIVDDLNKYIGALEKAVLEFHKAKMVQINKNIRELWRDIYRGNDIDYIEIKTEHGTGNAKRRSYNYKVVQVKKGIELDMRGRCSAGQKVLACLIIRMALAETLSTNCGVLALDEPTTNLDRDNILSLSDTLSKIVNSRVNEKNFQLIIITHDEEFLNTLTRVQGVDHYYRVCRDDDGFSVIKREQA